MIHFMLDGYGGSENRLDDLRTVNAVLNDIVTQLGTEAVMPPFLLPYYYAKDGEDDGISAFVILRGGHITLHTFPRRGCVFADLLYDGYADEDKFIELLRTYFKFEQKKSLCTERRYADTTIDADRIWNGDDEGDFGPHMIARVENVDTSFEQIFDMLDELPQQINMLPISRPYVLKSRKASPEYISGVVLIAQSHIAFHYSISERTLYCDAFSCSFYKSEQFVRYLEQKFASFEHMTLIRGSKHEKKINSRQARIKDFSRWAVNSSSPKGD
ncbi:MAG: S-adenosylmethionine decarboxylase [Clostridiales bacterium]|nr:S-adenosylmethionine decarboxylase [Clostridiales bacterium]